MLVNEPCLILVTDSHHFLNFLCKKDDLDWCFEIPAVAVRGLQP